MKKHLMVVSCLLISSRRGVSTGSDRGPTRRGRYFIFKKEREKKKDTRESRHDACDL